MGLSVSHVDVEDGAIGQVRGALDPEARWLARSEGRLVKLEKAWRSVSRRIVTTSVTWIESQVKEGHKR